jgi:mRNA-degrading endonuclease RelE of RelBE toxin-antitoxin system
MFTIEYQEHVISRHIPDLPSTVRQLIKRAIVERLMVDPVGLGKPLQYSLKGHRRLRVGDYRVIFTINLIKRVVTIVAIKHRKEIYDV